MNRFKSIRFGLLAAAAVALLIAGGVFSSSPVSAGGPTLTVDSITLEPGEEGTIDLTALGIEAPGLAAWSVTINNESGAVVTIVGCTAHPSGVCNPRVGDNGPVTTTGASAGGLEGDTVLATISLMCGSAEGSSTFGLKPLDTFADATPGDAQDITAALVDGVVTCESTAPPADTPTATPTDDGTPADGTPADTAVPPDGTPTIAPPPTGAGGSGSGVPAWLIATLAGAGVALAAGFGALKLSARRS